LLCLPSFGLGTTSSPRCYNLEHDSKSTFAIALQNFVRGSQGSVFGTQWNLLMAANIVVTVPIVVLFFAAQRYFVGGSA